MTATLGAANPARYGTSGDARSSAGVAVPGQDRVAAAVHDRFPRPDRQRRSADVAQVPIAAKAAELKQVINEIKRITGHSKVIVVGHSLGGLVGRWYIQRGAGATPYEGDVAALATIDTPHLGSSLAAVRRAGARARHVRAVPADCHRQTGSELAPGSATLTTLNASPLRGGHARRVDRVLADRVPQSHAPTRS